MTERAQNADFRLVLEIPAFGVRRKPQKTADFRRKPQIFTENRSKPQIGFRHLRYVTFSLALIFAELKLNFFRVFSFLREFNFSFCS